MESNAKLIVTIDGPAGSGKSTIARRLAEALDVNHLDTGAMYRAVGWAALERDVVLADGDAVTALAEALEIGFDFRTRPARLIVDGVDCSDTIRTPRVSEAASKVATHGGMRAVLVAQQQRMGREHGQLVSEGRDQGSVVFPDATVKFYLDASPQVRAKRRGAELRERGVDVNEADLVAEIKERDHRDMSRKDGPLVCPEDAVRVDSSDLSIDQVVEKMRITVTEMAGAHDA